MHSAGGRCDASSTTPRSSRPCAHRCRGCYGPLVGVIDTEEHYGVVLPTGSPLASAVNDALAAIISQGSLATISKRWLSTDLAKLRALR